MRSLKLVGLAVVLALGAGVTGYALAARPAESPVVERAECAVPIAVVPEAVVPTVDVVEEVVARTVESPRESAGGAVRRSDVTDGRTEGGTGLRSRRLVITHAIEGHEPVDELEVVDGSAERVYAFVDLANPGEATTVEVTFRHESGLSVGRVALEIPAHSARYRTWAYSSHVEEPGNWTAIVRDREGHTVAALPFEVR